MNTNHQRIGVALELLSSGLFPFFEQSLRAAYGERWEDTVRVSCRSQATVQPGCFRWDAQAMLTVMWDTWNSVFRRSLGLIERSVVSELREFRNRWAHQTTMTEDDAYRVLDSVQRLLVACGAESVASQVEEQKFDLLREKLGRRVNEELARARFNRARLVDVGLYAVCAAAIMTMMILMWGDRHPMSSGFVVGFTLFVFVYLIYRRFQASPPAYGVHECGQCRKVIYSENCPYCNPAPRHESKGGRAMASRPQSGDDSRRQHPATVSVG
ncbi:Swt1 family HEPN domain-containing protein [Schlesneria paludicola]|uniref:Swt1 family HEPN domain-containing protein n=1 Tax=Schlesneria paludicola TaxID=360056 RepID=UPI00029A00BA|nr:Swt1 family HEPN domain-containing protein [Schlesneria paludicola]